MARIALTTKAGVASLTLDNGPLNLYDVPLQQELTDALDRLERAGDARVCVLESAVDDFFVAHYDVRAIIDEPPDEERTAPGPFNLLMRRFRESSLVSIGKVRGAARGGGFELLLALDMRFAALDRATFALPEAWLGILAAGGGTQRLPALAGRARALELLLGGGDVDAEQAERWGLVNRALPDQELDAYVDRLALDIAAHPPAAVRFAKLAVNHSTPEPPGLALEALLLDQLKGRDITRARVAAFLDAGGQTVRGERSFRDLLEATRASGAASSSD